MTDTERRLVAACGPTIAIESVMVTRVTGTTLNRQFYEPAGELVDLDK